MPQTTQIHQKYIFGFFIVIFLFLFFLIYKKLDKKK
jgi:hypothetical protein